MAKKEFEYISPDEIKELLQPIFEKLRYIEETLKDTAISNSKDFPEYMSFPLALEYVNRKLFDINKDTFRKWVYEYKWIEPIYIGDTTPRFSKTSLDNLGLKRAGRRRLRKKTNLNLN